MAIRSRMLAGIFTLALLLSCGKAVIVVPDDPVYPTSGTATVSNKSVSGYSGSGFFFQTGRVIYYPNVSEVFPDISVRIQSLQPEFWSVDGKAAYKLLNTSADSASAQAFFDSLATLTDTTGFASTLSGISACQTIAVRDQQNKYAKIVILKASVDSSITEVTFRWLYQPDGTTHFQLN